MRKKLLLTLFLGSSLLVMAEPIKPNAIYAWVDGDHTCYLLNSMPKISYSGSQAILSFADETTPLVIDLATGKVLKVTFGEYQSTDLNASTQPVKQVGKYIRGGRLLIYKNGALYDVNGQLIQQK